MLFFISENLKFWIIRRCVYLASEVFNVPFVVFVLDICFFESLEYWNYISCNLVFFENYNFESLKFRKTSNGNYEVPRKEFFNILDYETNILANPYILATPEIEVKKLKQLEK